MRLRGLSEPVPGGDRRTADAAGRDAVGTHVDPSLRGGEAVNEKLRAALVLYEDLQLPSAGRRRSEARGPAPGCPGWQRRRPTRVVDRLIDLIRRARPRARVGR